MSVLMKELDVFLRSGRSYVQGTQMLARASEIVGESWELNQVLFSQITDSIVEISEEDCKGCLQCIGEVEFKKHDESKRMYLYATEKKAPTYTIDMPISISRIQSNEAATVGYSFEMPLNFENMINAIVQSIKSEHSVIFGSPHDVWWTGFRQFSLPTSFSHQENITGLIELKFMRKLGRNGNFQSLWQLTVTCPKSTYTGFVTFSFKL